MALTADNQSNTLVGNRHTIHSDRAKAATYYRGQFVQWDAALDLVGVASGSTGSPGAVAGTVVCGIVDEQQVIATTGDQLKYKRGWVAMTCNAETPNQLVFLSNDTTAAISGASALCVLGRAVGDFSGSLGSGKYIVDCGNTFSGSTL